jgi:hypothetical protein
MRYLGHLREAFLDGLEEDATRLARVEANYERQTWPASRLLFGCCVAAT